MVRPVGVFLILFAVLSLIVHQIAIFEFLTVLAIIVLAVDTVYARFSRTPRVSSDLRDPLL
jgi:hypothetical protein